jgi:hypothetical protein
MIEDEKIAALFASPERDPDEAFVAKVARMVAAEQKLAAAQRSAWRRFAGESVAAAAIVAAFDLVWRLTPAGLRLDQLFAAPAGAAAVLLLALWIAVELRPAAAAS